MWTEEPGSGREGLNALALETPLGRNAAAQGAPVLNGVKNP
jgi:hypothetical protein